MPDLVLKNGFTDFKPLGGNFYYVTVKNDGTVHWYPYMVFETKCNMDVSFYPFDRQTCKIIFKTWSYSRWEINLTVSADKVGFYEFVPNNVWEVTSTDATYDVTSSATDVVFIINLRRKSMYYSHSVGYSQSCRVYHPHRFRRKNGLCCNDVSHLRRISHTCQCRTSDQLGQRM